MSSKPPGGMPLAVESSLGAAAIFATVPHERTSHAAANGHVLQYLPKPAPDGCPQWCQAEHSTHGVRNDNTHWAEVRSFLAIERVPDTDDTDPGCAEQALPIEVGIEQFDGTGRTHVAIVIDEASARSLTVCPNSARQLARALNRAADLAVQ